MKQKLILLWSLIVALGAITTLNVLAQREGEKATAVSIPLESPATTISNAYIQVDVDDDGQFVIGTTGGDPDIDNDDDKRLLYGFFANGNSRIWSSYPSIRINSNPPMDVKLENVPLTSGPINTANGIESTWLIGDISVRQTLSFMVNPYSGRQDAVKIAYHVSTIGDDTVEVGVRSMLDTMVGNNDDAPFFVPTIGNSNLQQDFTQTIPSGYTAFEATDFASDSLKGQGILQGQELTTPDRFVIANWGDVYGTIWDYNIQQGITHGDSATVMYWNPQPIGNGFTVATAYGLASGEIGDDTWVDGPVLLPTDATSFDMTFWVNNTSSTDYTNGTASLTLPPGLSVASSNASVEGGSTVEVNIGTVTAGTVGQVNWTVQIDGGEGIYDYNIDVAFDSGQSFSTQNTVRVTDLDNVVFLPAVMKP